MTTQTPAVSCTSSSTIQSTTLSSSTAATILSAVSHIGLNATTSGVRHPRVMSTKSRKRPNQNHPVSFSAIPNSFVDKNNDFIWYDYF